jgi:hypothetical protein
MIYFLGNKNKLGFVFGLAANLSWMAFALITASLPIFLSNIVFMALNIRGLLRWRAALV